MAKRAGNAAVIIKLAAHFQRFVPARLANTPPPPLFIMFYFFIRVYIIYIFYIHADTCTLKGANSSFKFQMDFPFL